MVEYEKLIVGMRFECRLAVFRCFERFLMDAVFDAVLGRCVIRELRSSVLKQRRRRRNRTEIL